MADEKRQNFPPSDPIPDVHVGPVLDPVSEKPQHESTALVSVIMVSGPEGGKPRRWMTGPVKWMKGSYDFQVCCPTDVFPEDAKRLLAGGPELDGRTFARADSADGLAALAGAVPKGRW